MQVDRIKELLQCFWVKLFGNFVVYVVDLAHVERHHQHIGTGPGGDTEPVRIYRKTQEGAQQGETVRLPEKKIPRDDI
jgi:hypothetical protein